MHVSPIFTAVLAALCHTAAAQVKGSAEGFAKGVTGGNNKNVVYPNSNAELVQYLGDSTARTIVLRKTFDFTNTEGTANEQGCAPWGTGSGCQLAINKDNWCGNYQSNAPRVSVSYSKAGQLGITVGSNKSLVGEGSKGIIRGKGIRMVSGTKNVIIQNIHITDINPKYVWGGDAITIDNADQVWIDHVTTSKIGRQHIVFGTRPSGRVTVSNCEIDGRSTWSATCDGRHYWNMLFLGSNDMITLKGNYVHHTSGRAPKVGGNSLVHVVNNYWLDNSGQAFELSESGQVLVEGNVFQNVKATVEAKSTGQMFATGGGACSSALGRSCQVNAYGSSPALTRADTGFLANFRGKNIASASTAEQAKNVVNTAGFGRI